MILAITPNPAVDHTLVVPRMEVGGVHRATQTLVSAGGKGLNVARVVRQLGGEVTAFGMVAGHSGKWLTTLAAAEGIPSVWTEVEGETRTCMMVVAEGQETTVFNEQGPTITPTDWSRFVASIVEQAHPQTMAALSGSLPRGAPPHAPADLIHALQERGATVWVDSSGSALRHALTAKPHGIKINHAEASDLTGLPITTPDDAIAAAVQLTEQGIETVMITLGAQGAVLVAGANSYHAIPPSIPVSNNVGSGDAFFAAFLTAITENHSLPESLRRAVAAGSANAIMVESGSIHRRPFHTFVAQTVVTECSITVAQAAVRKSSSAVAPVAPARTPMEGLVEPLDQRREFPQFLIEGWAHIEQIIRDLESDHPATFHLFQDDKWWSVNFDKGRFALMFFLESEKRSFFLVENPKLTVADETPMVIGGQKVGFSRRYIFNDIGKVIASAKEFFETGTIDFTKAEWEEI